MIGLVRLLRTPRGFGAVEADLSRYHGIDLLDLYRPSASLTWRQVLVRWVNLPPDSASRTLDRRLPSTVEVLEMLDLWRREWLMSKGVTDPSSLLPGVAAAERAAAEAKAAELDAKRAKAKAKAERDRQIHQAAEAYEAQQKGE